MIGENIDPSREMMRPERTFPHIHGVLTVRLEEGSDGHPEVVATCNGVPFFGYRPARGENANENATDVFDHTCDDAEAGRLDPGKSHMPRQHERVATTNKTRIAVATAIAAIIALYGAMREPEAESTSLGSTQASITSSK